MLSKLNQINKAEFIAVQENRKTYYAKGRPMPIELLKYSSFIVLILEIVRIFLGKNAKAKVDEIIKFFNDVAGPTQIARYGAASTIIEE